MTSEFVRRALEVELNRNVSDVRASGFDVAVYNDGTIGVVTPGAGPRQEKVETITPTSAPAQTPSETTAPSEGDNGKKSASTSGLSKFTQGVRDHESSSETLEPARTDVADYLREKGVIVDVDTSLSV